MYSSGQIVRTLERSGFTRVSQRGSHLKLRKTTEQGVLTAIVPMGAREVPVGTFRSILKQARLTIEEFERILKSG
ncbi:MAG: type II toxin-antitoxin system HicA family toxin [Chloroflexi bacterium]|nr:type II toxin-antitoxin system HicA family toxin [Chloroflexota bacterium]MCZ6865966.1 type II toxin-antitoxin system HicA family toxin [Chloroflexota bacterium]